jgi:cytochrome c-type biogenesis protein CcsB
MNHELSYGGWDLFQSSYQQRGGREMTVLQVSRDPGQPIIYVGYALLIAGMIVILVTRMLQRRAAALRGSPVGGGAAAAILVALVTTVPGAAAVESLDEEVIDALRLLPVQHDGRVMPLDTMAREAVWQVTGSTRWQGTDPVALVLGWSFEPESWADRPVVRIGSAELARQAGLPEAMRHATFNELAESGQLLALVRESRVRAGRELPLTKLQEEALELEGRLVWMQRFLTGDILRVVPGKNPKARWALSATLEKPSDLTALLKEQHAEAPSHYPAAKAMQREVTYNQVRPSRLSWWILIPAAVLALLAWLRPRRWLDVLAMAGLLLGFAVMTWGIVVRWQIAGRIPASNMYESMLFLGWGVGLFALVAAIFVRNRLVIFNAAAMSALTYVLLDQLPIDPFVHPMAPVLSGTPWLAIHVPIIMVSYSVLTLGVLVAHMQVGLVIFAPARRDLVARMSDLLYWYMEIGAILLVAGIITGSVWAAFSWGRYWGWDPKEVWSLIAFLAYMAILHGRLERIIGPFGVAVASIAAFWGIVMTYVGVNFVLTAGLHSYGFGGGPVMRWMILLAEIEVFFLVICGVAHYRARRRMAA